MSLLDEFVRVNRNLPCPVCGETDWCLVDRSNPADPSRVLCPRTPSEKQWGSAGYFHQLRRDSVFRGPRPIVRMIDAKPNDGFLALAKRLHKGVDPDQLHRFALGLGVSVNVLLRMRIGLGQDEHREALGLRWKSRAWCFPMRDHRGRVIGIRLRLPGGKKLAVPGSSSGLFIPTGQQCVDRLLITEGESDCAAALTLGAAAIGRPGCQGADRMIGKYLQSRAPQAIVVVADLDGPGLTGGRKLAESLATVWPHVRLLVPPAKDLRAWLCSGATSTDLEDAIGLAPLLGRRSVAGGHRS